VAQIDEVNSRLRAADARRIGSRLDCYLGDAEHTLRYDATTTADLLRKTAAVLAETDTQRAFTGVELAAYEARAAVIAAKLAAMSRAGALRPAREVGGGWAAIQRDIEGWEREAIVGDVRALDPPEFPKTRIAIQRIRYFLDDPETWRSDPATYRQA